MKKKKILIIIIVLIAAAAVISLIVFKNTSSKNDSSSKIFVQSVSDVCENQGSTNRYNGIVEEQEKSKIEFDTSRTLKSINVKEGDHVNEGDVLFVYDTDSIELEIEQLNLEVDKLNTELTNNNSQLSQLNKDMANASETDKLEYTSRIAQTQSDIAQGEYDIKTKQAEIKKKQSSITASSITTPISGTISSIADIKSITNGTNVDSSGSNSNVYITVVKDGNLRVKGTISENNITEIKTDEKVTLVSRIDSTKTWSGVISSINTSSTASTDNSYYYSSGETASKYNFYVELDSADDLIIGQHLLIYSAETAQLKDGLWLNGGWICTDDDGTYYVWTAAKGNSSLSKTEITLGTYLEDLGVYEILSGITEDTYIAWPDSDCVIGAKTTTEAITEATDSSVSSGSESTDTDENFDISEDQGIGTDDYNIQGEDTDENSSLDIDNAESIQDESIAASSKETDEAK